MRSRRSVWRETLVAAMCVLCLLAARVHRRAEEVEAWMAQRGAWVYRK